MGKLMKILAIAALLATVAGAGAVLYGINTLSPRVEQAASAALPADQAQDVFAQTVRELEEGTFAGTIYPTEEGTSSLRAEDCTFVTYTVRFENKGFFPAEWISIKVLPADGTEVLMLPDNGEHVLNAGTKGDLSATILCRGGGADTPRVLEVSCYVFGRKIAFQIQAG